MGLYQNSLPQLSGKICITDGGLETDLCFNKQIELPEFAAYDLLRSDDGYTTLYDYYKAYAELAKSHSVGLILETPTWRANSDWGKKIGDSENVLNALNRKSVQLIEQIRANYQDDDTPIIISGCLGPRGDGYRPDNLMTAAEAKTYHLPQITTFANCNVDMIAALTLNYIDEAIGVTEAAKQSGLPVCISFTVETDGKLPTGETLEQAIVAVDKATDNGPAYYMINCAHPTHFDYLFSEPASWMKRLKGIRGNASRLSHAELDESKTLDDGNPEHFGIELGELKRVSPSLSVFGGCCGTDLRHISEVCRHLTK